MFEERKKRGHWKDYICCEGELALLPSLPLHMITWHGCWLTGALAWQSCDMTYVCPTTATIVFIALCPSWRDAAPSAN